MECPFCGSRNQKVIDKRESRDNARRRRVCLDCNQRFTSYEITDKKLNEYERYKQFYKNVVFEAKKVRNHE